MLDSQVPDALRDQAADEAKARLEAKGEILHEANWGIRKMAYEIDRRETSDYRFYKFNGDKDLLDDLGHSLKIADAVLRFRIFKAELDAPTAEPPDTEQIMRRDEDDRPRREGRGGPRREGRGGPRRDDDEGRGAPRREADEAPAPAAAAESPAAAAE